jgi:hypothetical protein
MEEELKRNLALKFQIASKPQGEIKMARNPKLVGPGIHKAEPSNIIDDETPSPKISMKVGFPNIEIESPACSTCLSLKYDKLGSPNKHAPDLDMPTLFLSPYGLDFFSYPIHIGSQDEEADDSSEDDKPPNLIILNETNHVNQFQCSINYCEPDSEYRIKCKSSKILTSFKIPRNTNLKLEKGYVVIIGLYYGFYVKECQHFEIEEEGKEEEKEEKEEKEVVYDEINVEINKELRKFKLQAQGQLDLLNFHKDGREMVRWMKFERRSENEMTDAKRRELRFEGPYLELVWMSLSGMSFDFDGFLSTMTHTSQSIVVGRSKSHLVKIPIPSYDVSLQHAQIAYDHSKGFYVRDLDSKKGTYIALKTIQQVRSKIHSDYFVLQKGMVLNIGDRIFKVENQLGFNISQYMKFVSVIDGGEFNCDSYEYDAFSFEARHKSVATVIKFGSSVDLHGIQLFNPIMDDIQCEISFQNTRVLVTCLSNIFPTAFKLAKGQRIILKPEYIVIIGMKHGFSVEVCTPNHLQIKWKTFIRWESKLKNENQVDNITDKTKEFKIGRRSDLNNRVLEARDISGNHCKIGYDENNGRWYLEEIESKCGTYIALTTRAKLKAGESSETFHWKSGMILRLANCLFQRSPQYAPPNPPKYLRLEASR